MFYFFGSSWGECVVELRQRCTGLPLWSGVDSVSGSRRLSLRSSSCCGSNSVVRGSRNSCVEIEVVMVRDCTLYLRSCQHLICYSSFIWRVLRWATVKEVSIVILCLGGSVHQLRNSLQIRSLFFRRSICHQYLVFEALISYSHFQSRGGFFNSVVRVHCEQPPLSCFFSVSCSLYIQPSSQFSRSQFFIW